MGAHIMYTRGTSLLLAAQALSLLISPSTTVYLLTSSPPSGPSGLELWLCRTCGLALLCLALLNLLLSGDIARILSDGESSTKDHNKFKTPTVAVTMVYHVAAGLNNYLSSSSTELASFWFSIGGLAHGVLAAAGLLLLMFGDAQGHISRRTGADKRVSGFPFKNAEADKKRGKIR